MKGLAVGVAFLIASPAFAAPVLTGDVAADFDLAGAISVADPGGVDVAIPLAFPAGTISGFDIASIRVFHDPVADTLFVGMETFGIAGDADGDGDPDSASVQLSGLGGQDTAQFSGTETFGVSFDLDGDGSPELIAGVSNVGDLSTFDLVQHASVPVLGSNFGPPIIGHDSPLFFTPSAATPHLEFSIADWSALVAALGGDGTFVLAGHMGSLQAAGIGADLFDPGSTVCLDADQDGLTICAGDCDDRVPTCLLDCSDSNDNSIPDCAEDCVDADGDGYGEGTGCLGPDCHDGFASCIDDCVDFPDGDGIPNCGDPDDDNDGLSDSVEINTVGTDPLDADTDDGGVNDGDEVANGTEPIDTPEDDVPSCIDGDGDGYGVGSACLGPDCLDSAPTCTTECVHTDNDGIPNCADPDDDNDGLTDGIEEVLGTDPLDPDTDGGGAMDGAEVQNGTNPLNNPDDDFISCADPDGDGYGIGPDCDGADCFEGFATCTTECIHSDSDSLPNCADDDDDNDGLLDVDEPTYGTDPLDPDTDDGGIRDGPEVDQGTNPLDNPDDDFGTCTDADSDGYGEGLACIDEDCDDTTADCNVDCTDTDQDGLANCLDPDDDNDGLPDLAEPPHGTDPLDPDSDDGGVVDGAEVLNGTNPADDPSDDFGLCQDGDGDGHGVGAGCQGADCDDTLETCTTDCTDHDLDGIPSCADDDDDDDGLLDVDEPTHGTDPLDPDTDDGGVNDGDEVANGTNPLDDPSDDACGDTADFDGDGDPNCTDPDDDNDGLLDVDEPTHGTDPLDPDTDDGGVTDGQEVLNGTEPSQTPEDDTGAACTDADGDGYGAGSACLGEDCDDTLAACTDDCTDHDGDGVPSCGDADDDNDGLLDVDEPTHGTDPLDPDTDDGGVMDGEEVAAGTNPFDNPDDDEQIVYVGGPASCSAGSGPGPASGAALVLLLALALLARRTRVWGLALLVAASAPLPAQAQDGFNVQHFTVVPHSDRIFAVEGTHVAPAWRPTAGIFLHYMDDALELRRTVGTVETTFDAVDQFLNADLALGFGIGGFMDLQAILPIKLFGDGDTNRFSGVDDGAVGDLHLRARFRLVDRATSRGWGLALSLGVTAPLDETASMATDKGASVILGAAAALERGRWLLASNLRFRFRTDDDPHRNLTLGHELIFGLGTSVRAASWMRVGAEIFGRGSLEEGGIGNTPVEIVMGPKFLPTPTIGVDLGFGFGVTDGYGAPDWRFFAGLGYTPAAGPAPAAPSVVDTDGDGLPDSEDQCPRRPEDVDTWQDLDGCPDPDNDDDKIADVRDRCPLEPEDRDQFEDADGCPDPDNDRDGILDVDDKCPNVAENINGFEDTDGCPDTPDAHLDGDQIKVLKRMEFDTSKWDIRDDAAKILSQVASILRAHPEILLIEVQGHTDSRNTDKSNMTLSQERASSVVRWLVDHGGISRARLIGHGYGERRPRTTNRTRTGRQENRRVEFHVLKRLGPDDGAVKDRD